MKVDELRVLEEDELGTRLKSARRELYELRFKDAVGQLENRSQIAKARHDIARIMTVLNERVLGISTIQIAPPLEVAESVPAKPKKAKAKRAEFVDEEVEQEPAAAAEAVEAVAAEPEAPAAEPEKPKRARRTKAEKES
jgi:large subunit ribosomal protein L29